MSNNEKTIAITGATDSINGAMLTNQSHLTDSHVQLRGTGTPGDVIAIYKDLPSRPDGSSLPEGTHANVVVQADGTWSFDTVLSENRNYYTAVSTSTGEYSGNPFNLFLDPSPVHAKVSISGAIDLDNGASLSNSSHLTDSHVQLRGTGTPGDVIAIYKDLPSRPDGSSLPEGTHANVVVQADGTWSFDTVLSENRNYYTAVSTSTGEYSGNPFNLFLDPSPVHAKVSISGAIDLDNGASLSNSSHLTDSHVQLRGTGTPGDVIAIYKDLPSRPDGSSLPEGTHANVVVQADGTWSFDTALSENRNYYTAVSTSTGEYSGNPFNLFLDPSPVHAKVSISGAIDLDNGASLSNKSHLTDSHVQLHGTGTPGDVIAIYKDLQLRPDGSSLPEGVHASVTVQADGTWSFDTALSENRNYYTAVSTSTGEYSGNPFNLFLDPSSVQMSAASTSADAVSAEASHIKVSISGAIDLDNGASLSNQSHLTDSHVQLRGTGTPGDVIAIYKDLPSRPDGSSLPEGTHASVVVQADGTWSFDTALSENRNYYTAVSTSTGDYSGGPFNLYLDPGLKVSATGDHQILHLDSVAGQTAVSAHASADVHQSTPKVSLTDVLDLGEKDLFPHSSQLPVAITCQQGNAVELPNTHVADGAWLQHGAAVVSGVTHNVFLDSGAHVDLLVQQSVATVLHQ